MTSATASTPTSVIARLNDAFHQHDPEALDGLLAENCVLHTASPGPNGAQIRGGPACREYWGALLADEAIQFAVEEQISEDETVAQQWRCVDQNGQLIRRGVNIFVVRNGLISSAHGYVKASG